MSTYRTAHQCSHAYPQRLSFRSAALFFLTLAQLSNAVHHMKRTPKLLLTRQDGQIPVVVSNQCADTIHPGIATQHGHGPETNGFKLDSGEEKKLNVSMDWQGRIWGRTNCTFNKDGTAPANNAPGRACTTGDCGGVVDCRLAGEDPVTLAEFTSNAGDGQSYYDISLVDGYNLPMAIIAILDCGAIQSDISSNETNPSCVATSGELAPQSFNPYSSGDQKFLNTDSNNQLPFETDVSHEQCHRWCPWDLQVNPPKKPGDGVYPYPDDNIERPGFNPCFSACAKYHEPQDCCTGKYNDPNKCKANLYSREAKKVCPDAYSFAYDDQDSTFVIPAGCGFRVVFCPGGRSTTIISSAKDAAVIRGTVPPGKREGNEGNSHSGAQMPATLDSQQVSSGSSSLATLYEIAGLTWWLMGAGLVVTAGVFVLL